MNIAPHKMNVSIHKAQKRYILAQPSIPQVIEVPDLLRSRLNEMASMLAMLPAGSVIQNLSRMDSLACDELANHAWIAPLRHNLGAISVIRNRGNDGGIPRRSETEKCVLDEHYAALMQSIEQPNPDNFIEEVLAISASVKEMTTGGFRKSGVRLAGDKAGWAWQFPGPKGIALCLTNLHAILHQRVFSNAIVEATVAYVILNWMHPFSDGNGRTSRVVFNGVLRRHGMASGHYLPIKEINYLAHGGHEVRLRYTVATGDWKELLEYFVNATALYMVLLHKEVIPTDGRM